MIPDAELALDAQEVDGDVEKRATPVTEDFSKR